MGSERPLEHGLWRLAALRRRFVGAKGLAAVALATRVLHLLHGRALYHVAGARDVDMVWRLGLWLLMGWGGDERVDVGCRGFDIEACWVDVGCVGFDTHGGIV